MNRHRDDLALIMDSADFRRDSHVRARTPGLAADLENVIVRPTILIHDRRYERRVEAVAGALAVQAAKLHALLAEPLTRPLGSMQTPRCFVGDEAITLPHLKPLNGEAHLPADYRHVREVSAAAIRGVPRTEDRSRHVAPSASEHEPVLGGAYHPYKEQREALSADDQHRYAAQSNVASDTYSGADFPRHAAAPLREWQHNEDGPRRGAGSAAGREPRSRGAHHDAAQFAPSREGPNGDRHSYAAQPCDIAASASMREPGLRGDHYDAAHFAPVRDESFPAREAARSADRYRGAARSEHIAASASMREPGLRDDHDDAAHFAPAREAMLSGDRHRYTGQFAPMCEELPTDDRLRFDAPLASRRDAQLGEASHADPDTDADTYHGLRQVREQAHARLESLESAAVSGKTAVARPHSAARARDNAPVASVLRQPGATPSADDRHRSAKPRSSSGKRRRSEGLTDARNALRRAYAESKLRLPNAPPRSSAQRAGVVDGWERVPNKKAKCARSRRKGSRAMWPWAAALALSSMFFAYTLTLTVVPEQKLVSPPRPHPVATAPAHDSPARVAPIDQPRVDKPPANIRPRAASTKPPKPPARATARIECREQTAPAN